MSGHRDDEENATAGLEPECGVGWNSSTSGGNCSADAMMAAGGPPGAWMIASLLLYGLICAAGTVGNGLVIYVVLRSDIFYYYFDYCYYSCCPTVVRTPLLMGPVCLLSQGRSQEPVCPCMQFIRVSQT